MNTQDHAAAGVGSALVGGGTYLALLYALRKNKLSTLAKHLIAGGAGLAAGGATYGGLGYLANKYAETPEQMRANIAKAKLPLEVVSTEDGAMLRTTAPYTYKVGDKTVTIPKGFYTDGVSTPTVLRWLTGAATNPKTLRAGLIHDHEFRTADGSVGLFDMNRRFVENIKTDGMPKVKAELMGFGLNATGWAPYLVRRIQNSK